MVVCFTIHLYDVADSRYSRRHECRTLAPNFFFSILDPLTRFLSLDVYRTVR